MHHMDKQRIARNVKQLKMAKELVLLAFEDLKNVQSFRDSEGGSVANRDKVIELLALAIEEGAKAGE